MKKITLVCLFLLGIGLNCHAQAVSGYLLSESSEIYAAVSGTNSSASGDDGSQNNIPIGFNFSFGGADYSTFSISTNGFIRLGTAVGGNNWTNVLSNTAPQMPLIAAFWDDNNRNTGSIQYNVSGVAPNRTLEVGWNNINIGNGGATNASAFASFKMRLHETSGSIDLIYGAIMNSAGTLSASIGLNDLSTFLSVTPASGPATVSGMTANNSISSTGFVINKKYTFTPQPVCSETPAPGNTIASLPSVCANQDFSLSLENQGNGYGLGHQWQSSADGTNFTDISGANGSFLNISQTASTYYQCIVNCGAASATSLPVLVTMNPSSTCYCLPNYTTGKTDGDLISNVVITGTTLSNNSGTAAVNPPYTYFTGQPNYTATLQAGVNYEINVTVGSYGQQNSAVWIDYNDDAVFSPEERVGYSLAEIGSFGTGTYTIALACDPPAGVHRMRVRDVYNTDGVTIDPCATYGYGETEDYDITILAAASCPAPYALGTGQVNATTAQLQWTSGCGQLSWDIHVTAAGGGSPVGAASNPGVSTNPFVVTGLVPSTGYEFYVMAYCGTNGNSTWAGPFAFTTAPPAVANDECDTAFVLIPGSDFNENAMVATNAGASKSIGPPNPTCAVFGFGGDVWFSIVVPASGNVTVETQSDAGSPLIDTGMTAFSGTCGALTTLGCSDDEGVDAFSILSLTGLTPGETIYARVWEYANDTIGSFRVSAYDSALGTDTFDAANFAYYPNPVKNTLNLSSRQNITEVKVFNILGQQMIVKPLNNTQGEIDMSALPKGTYMVKVLAGNQVKTIKIIKE